MLRGTGRAHIHAHVYANPRGGHGANVLALHGFTTTGLTFEPLARAIFDDRILGHAVQRVVTEPDAVHAMYVSNPAGLLDALRPMF